ncbi:MAG: hypothetical protein C0467_14085 [Planctomycetaceae bacterium]|nr:hypothetical protein [Planctomycetaceae bacterium]
MELALALHMTRQELRDRIDSQELVDWAAFKQLHGFPIDRVVAGIALSGAAIVRSLGNKIEPEDLIAVFKQQELLPYDVWAEAFTAYAIKHNKRLNG